MKSTKFVFLIIFNAFILNYLSAQKINFSKITFSLDFKNKIDLAYEKDPPPLSRNDKEYTRLFGMAVRYPVKEHIAVETGYSFEGFEKGWGLSDGFGNIDIVSTTYLATHSIPLRLVYNKTLLGSRSLFFEPTLGAITCIRYNDGDIGGDGLGVLTGTPVTLIETDRKGYEYNLKQVFFLLEARMQLRYQLARFVAMYIGGGYSQGTSTIGRTNAVYTQVSNPIPTNINKRYRGSNVYFNTGLRISLSNQLAIKKK